MSSKPLKWTVFTSTTRTVWLTLRQRCHAHSLADWGWALTQRSRGVSSPGESLTAISKRCTSTSAPVPKPYWSNQLMPESPTSTPVTAIQTTSMSSQHMDIPRSLPAAPVMKSLLERLSQTPTIPTTLPLTALVVCWSSPAMAPVTHWIFRTPWKQTVKRTAERLPLPISPDWTCRN